MVFPYYIVRFKPFIALLTDTKPQCFHTTQYDLNMENKKRIWGTADGFHTTQYDLNQGENGTEILGGEFPYYIVRFKPFCLFYIHFINIKFPYYIVRFKLSKLSVQQLRYMSFHTTQYDLNQLYFVITIIIIIVSILHSTI